MSREQYDATPIDDRCWLDIASDYASTEDGRRYLAQQEEEAEVLGRARHAAALRAALARGETLRIARADADRLNRPRRPRVLQPADIDQVRAEFGVAEEQVRRDHAISHILAALSVMPDFENLVFFGGTALSRTYLPTLRLSEDIDLITRAERNDVAGRIERTLPRALQRSHGSIEWLPPLTDVRETEPAILRTASGIMIRMQLLAAAGYPSWPVLKHQLVQRYADAPPAELNTYTPEAFAASKLNAWLERHAVRDLYDMWALGRSGYVNSGAVTLFRTYGATGGPPAAWMFTDAPAAQQWNDALSHQCKILVGPSEALAKVREAWLSSESAN